MLNPMVTRSNINQTCQSLMKNKTLAPSKSHENQAAREFLNKNRRGTKIMTNRKTWDHTVLPKYHLLRANVISVQCVALVDAVQHPNCSSRAFLFETWAQ